MAKASLPPHALVSESQFMCVHTPGSGVVLDDLKRLYLNVYYSRRLYQCNHPDNRKGAITSSRIFPCSYVGV